jgi:type II secretory pathway pseudopilin PulG
MSNTRTRREGSSWIRGAVVLAVLGALTAAVLVSPVGAAPTLTKAKVKTIATKVVNQALNGYQEEVHWALVDTGGTVVASSGGVTVTPGAPGGSRFVNFGQDISGRAILATQHGGPGGFGEVVAAPCGGPTPFPLVTCTGANTTSHVSVTTSISNGTPTNLPFYVAVIK